MVVEYFAYYMLTNSATTEVKGFLDKYDMFFFPVVNPDGTLPPPLASISAADKNPGFVYSQTNDRLWRKNRQSTSGSTCIGHDINRNWPYQWSVTGGASTSPCAQDFKGTSAGDAPETAALSAWLKATKASQGLKLFIDWHAYSQLFMTRKRSSSSPPTRTNIQPSLRLLVHRPRHQKHRVPIPRQGRRRRHEGRVWHHVHDGTHLLDDLQGHGQQRGLRPGRGQRRLRLHRRAEGHGKRWVRAAAGADCAERAGGVGGCQVFVGEYEVGGRLSELFKGW